MSGSFDDCSNLYDDSTDDVANVVDDYPNPNDDTKSKKSSKEKPKRPKAPIINLFSGGKGSATDNKPKLNVPLKAPTRPPPPKISAGSEKRIDEVQRTLLDKTPEEKSAEWWAFQQMQERITLSLQQTKTSLHKLATSPDAASESVQDIDDKTCPIAENVLWTSFDSSAPVTSKQNLNFNAPLLPGIPDVASVVYEDKLSQSNNIQQGKHLLHLSVSPLPSPQLAPKPPANSLNVSMEDITASTNSKNQNTVLNLLDFDGSSSVTDSALIGDDLLGFESANKKTTVPENYNFMEIHSFPDKSKTDSSAMSLVDDFLGISGDGDKKINPDKQSLDFLSNLSKTSSDITATKSCETLGSIEPKEAITNGDLMACSPDGAVDPFIVNTVIPPHSDFMSSTNVASLKDSQESSNPFLEHKSPEKTDSYIVKTQPIDPFQMLFNSAQTDEIKQEDTDVAINTPEDLDLVASKRANVKALLDTGFMNRNAEQLSAAAVSPVIEPSSAFLCSLTQDDRSPSVNEFDDDDFFTREAPAPKTAESVWGTSVIDTDATVNQFICDDFSSKPMSEINEMESTVCKQNNPFLNDEFSEAVISDSSVINPFINEAVDLTNRRDDLDHTFPDPIAQVLQSDSSDPFKSHIGALEDETFDPFGTNVVSTTDEQTSPDAFQAAVLSGSGQLVQPDPSNFDDELEEGMFQLEIRSSAIPSGPVPLLPAPPKSFPVSEFDEARVNPFDNESPPEENFAEFPVQAEEIVTKKKSESVSSDETITPEGEQNLEPLPDYHPQYTADGWTLMIRQPVKKKITTNRFWKEVYVRILLDKGDNPLIKIFSDDTERRSNQELPLQSCYSLSDLRLQQYDQYGKIHTFKLQYVFYKERVGLRAERLTPNFVKKPKPTMILDHSPQISELLKFGSLDKELLRSFIWALEDALMNLKCQRDKTLNYSKDDVTMELWDEYEALINKTGHVMEQKARVRIFCLAFLSGMPECELGVNDRRRKGKEVVGRHDIIPVKTEEWIRMEDVKCHSVVNNEEYEKTSNIKFVPLDACQFEVMRFRVRIRDNLELPLHVSIEQTLDDRHLEIRCNMLVTGYHANTKKYGQFPCEDIEVRFPIPECWIYLFRVERRFGYGSVRSIARKPGKIKGIERITMMAQSFLTPTLMETSTGTAKYEHIYRSVVWRVTRLPERNQGAYTNHLFTLKIDLGPHDEIPQWFEPHAHVEFTMPASTVSKAQIRSFSVDNSSPPEKWVKYVAKYKYAVEIAHTAITEDEITARDNGYGGGVGEDEDIKGDKVKTVMVDDGNDGKGDSDGDADDSECDDDTEDNGIVEQPGY